MHNLYRIEEQSIPCWVWREDRLEAATLSVSNPPCAIWDALNDLDYISVSMYKGKGALVTYLYRHFGETTEVAHQYVALSLVDALGDFYDDAEAFQRGELVLLPNWLAVIRYLSMLLPIVLAAEESDHNWDRK